MGIQQILLQIYQIDPSLKENETVLMGLLQQIVANQPSLVVDQDFVNRLKSYIEEQKPKQEVIDPSKLVPNIPAPAVSELSPSVPEPVSDGLSDLKAQVSAPAPELPVDNTPMSEKIKKHMTFSTGFLSGILFILILLAIYYFVAPMAGMPVLLAM